MKAIIVIFLTILFFAFEIAFTYIIPIGWISLLAIALMGFFIFTGYKQTALAIVISLFLYGATLAFMDKQFYVTHHIKVVRNFIYDKEGKKVFELSFEDVQKVKRIKNSQEQKVVCQHYTLFGYETSEHFCYYKVNSHLFPLKELQRH